MPKIIEPPKGKRVTCRACKAVIGYMPNKVKTGRFGAAYYAGDSGETRRYITCPACHEAIFLP